MFARLGYAIVMVADKILSPQRGRRGHVVVAARSLLCCTRGVEIVPHQNIPAVGASCHCLWNGRIGRWR